MVSDGRKAGRRVVTLPAAAAAAAVRAPPGEHVATDESNSSHSTRGSMNDINSTGGQVKNDVITSSSSSHLDQWIADVTQRQYGAADRLDKVSCDCTFCVPDITCPMTTFRAPKSATTTAASKPVFTCTSCSRSFASEKYLNMHAALHRKSTSSSRSNVTTMQTLALAGNKDKWTCEVCGKIFAHTSNYKNHIRTHSDDRPFVCHVCSIGFKERYHLKKHTLFKHTGELNEACRRCGKRFKDSTAVRAHERIHSDARPYACQRCGKAFKTSECLWHHDHRSKTCGRPRHGANRPAVVSSSLLQADDSLVSLSELVDHTSSLTNVDVKQAHDSAVKTEETAMLQLMTNTDVKSSSSEMLAPTIPWLSHSTKPVAVVIGQHVTGSGIKQRSICSRCGKQFASSLAFERHLAVHSLTRPYRCHICDVGFKLKVHLKKHNLYRHNSDYPCQCRVCGKPFKDSSAVRLHERIHSNARPFQCACGKSFKTRENLWGHRHRRPCVGRYTACLSGLTQSSSVDSLGCLQPPAMTNNVDTSLRPVASSDVSVVSTDTDNLLMFDTTDCISVDSKLLPPFETFIPPLRTADTPTNSTSLVRYHNYADWSPAAVPHDVIWWSSATANYPSSQAMIASHSTITDVIDDWSSDWPKKLSM